MKIEEAKIYDLEQPRFAGMPAFPVLTPQYHYGLHRRHADTYNPAQSGPRSGATGAILAPDHSGTHVDAICHQADELKLMGQVAVAPGVETPSGFTQLGAETIAPFVTQGFLLDVAHFKGAPALAENYAITAEDLEGAMKAQGRLLMPGGVILIRTGYGQFWNDAAKYAQAAGLAPDANRWILAKHPRAVGADNLAWDAPGVRDETTGATLFGHLELLARNGIYIFENLNLEELAAQHVDHFLFLAAPLKLKGATAAPVRPLALEIQMQSSEFMQP
ncbi:MAG: cyclase family protein [Chloroflexi bacterium]|nr:cyclase family protein [Chloroflexota bacterium]